MGFMALKASSLHENIYHILDQIPETACDMDNARSRVSRLPAYCRPLPPAAAASFGIEALTPESFLRATGV